MIHSYFSSSFNQIVKNQNYNKLLKLKTDAKKRERDNEIQNFNVENIRRDKKQRAYNRSKTFTMKNKN